MRKGQSEIIYLVIAIGIAVLIAGGVFTFSQSYGRSVMGQLADAGLERVAAQVESGLLEIKSIKESTNEQNISIKLPIPTKIGSDSYTISGLGNNSIILSTSSEKSISKLKTITAWNGTIQGSSDSSRGVIELQLKNATAVLLR